MPQTLRPSTARKIATAIANTTSYSWLISCARSVTALGGNSDEPAPLQKTRPTMAIRRTTTPPATIASEAGRFLGLVDMAPRLRRRYRDPGAWDRGPPGDDVETADLRGPAEGHHSAGSDRCAVRPWGRGSRPALPRRRRRHAGVARLRTRPRADPRRAAEPRDP